MNLRLQTREEAGEWEEKSKKTKQDCQWLEKNRYFYWVEKTKCAKKTRVSQSLEPLTDKNRAKTKDWTYIPLLTLKT